MVLTDITQLFKYTEWANNLAMDAAAKLSVDQLRRDVGISHKSIFETLLHMAGAEWIWLERWNGRFPAKDQAWSSRRRNHALTLLCSQISGADWSIDVGNICRSWMRRLC